MDELNCGNLAEVITAVEDCAIEHHHLGLMLGLKPPTLQHIEKNHDDEKRRLIEVLKAWLKKVDGVRSTSWESLVAALKGIGQASVAMEIELKKGIKSMSLP